MKVKTPRLLPLPISEVAEELHKASMSKDGVMLNIHRTLAHHPKLAKRWLVFGTHILSKNSLPPREREILILRIGWLCQSEYELAQHARIGKAVGLTDEDLKRIAAGPDAPGWDPFEATLLRAVDELNTDKCISDATWQALSERYDTKQLLDLVFTVGQYNLVSMALNTLGVQLEEGAEPYPGL